MTWGKFHEGIVRQMVENSIPEGWEFKCEFINKKTVGPKEARHVVKIAARDPKKKQTIQFERNAMKLFKQWEREQNEIVRSEADGES